MKNIIMNGSTRHYNPNNYLQNIIISIKSATNQTMIKVTLIKDTKFSLNT
jgi:hypothetical protein